MNSNGYLPSDNLISLADIGMKDNVLGTKCEIKDGKNNVRVKANEEDSRFPKVQLSTSNTAATKTKEVNPLVMRRMTMAGGFLDIALFSANCEQLKFVMELGDLHTYYSEVLGLIIASLVLQLLVGLTLFLMGCHVIKEKEDETYSNFLNHTTMGLVAVITIINIFVNTFGPKGTAVVRCLGAFSYANTKGPMWQSYLNYTRFYMTQDL